MKRRNNFTIIELLVVIAIIGILAGITFPAIAKAIERGRITKCRTEITNIVNAIKQYEATYGVLPVTAKSYDDATGTEMGGGKRGGTDTTYDNLMMNLSQVKMEKLSFPTGDAVINARKIPFLPVNQDFVKKGFVDPWGVRYKIIINSGYNPDGIKPSNFPEKLIGSVFVYSYGPNSKDQDASNNYGDDYGRNVTAGYSGTDDIVSWRQN